MNSATPPRKRRQASISTAQIVDPIRPFFDDWLITTAVEHQQSTYRVEIDSRTPSPQIEPWADHLKSIIRDHYIKPEIYARQLEELGQSGTAEIVRSILPSTHKVRAGELGEILMSEFTERSLSVPVPVKKLRNKDGRNNPIRGVDSLGVRLGEDSLIFVKGEAKVHRYITNTIIRQAKRALDENGGSISRYTALYVVQHSDPRNHDLHRACEAAAVGRRPFITHHLLFIAFERVVKNALLDYVSSVDASQPTYAIGLRLPNYKDFIRSVFDIAGAP